MLQVRNEHLRNYCMTCENSRLWTRLFDEERLVCAEGGKGLIDYPFFTELMPGNYDGSDGPVAYLYNELRAKRSFYYYKWNNEVISEWVLDNTTGRFFYGEGNGCYHIVFDKEADWLVTKLMFSDVEIVRIRSPKGPFHDEFTGGYGTVA